MIVGENGVPIQLPAGAPPDLLESARTVPLSDRPLPPLDPELQRALESLGYAE